MKFIKTKLVLFLILFVCIIFFSNDFGIIDIKRAAIITAIAIDYEDNEYSITTQIDVPEATDKNEEKAKTQITTKGETIASAIKHIGSSTGWFPQLYFCNLIIIGSDVSSENTIKILDYFAKTLRVQDSANVILSSTKGSDLLSVSSPFDDISSFAIQKILLKNQGFDNDIMLKNIKDFSSDYYSKSKSSFMPLVSLAEQKNSEDSSSSEGQSGGQEESSGSKKFLFNAKNTALFYEGVKVGELNKDETFCYNLSHSKCKGSEIVAKDVLLDNEYRSVLSIIQKHKYKTFLTFENNKINYNVDIKLKLKISDQTASESDSTYAKNIPIPEPVKNAIEEKITENLTSLFEKEKSLNCDFLKIKENLYRFHTKEYEKYKNDIYSNLNLKINLDIK